MRKQAIKEFSKSRLHFRALQEKQRQTTRSRVKRRVSPHAPGDDGKRKAREGGDEAMHAKDEGPGDSLETVAMKNDPLGLVRREIAVMKKLEWVDSCLLLI